MLKQLQTYSANHDILYFVPISYIFHNVISLYRAKFQTRERAEHSAGAVPSSERESGCHRRVHLVQYCHRWTELTRDSLSTDWEQPPVARHNRVGATRSFNLKIKTHLFPKTSKISEILHNWQRPMLYSP
jgi:hypothetical protein